MRAVVLSNGKLSIKDVPIPEPLPHEALVKVIIAGVCSTDLEILHGYVPGFDGIMGHEFCGIVEKAQESKWIGKRVCSGINMIDPATVNPKYDGCCLEHHPERTVLGIINKDGCFAEYVTVPIVNLIEIPDSVQDRMAVFTEPLAAALRIRDQVSALRFDRFRSKMDRFAFNRRRKLQWSEQGSWEC